MSKDLISGDAALSKFFNGKSISELIERELTVDKINSEIIRLHPGPRNEKVKENNLSKYEQKKNLILEVLTDTIRTIKNLFTQQSLTAKNEELVEFDVKQTEVFHIERDQKAN